MFLSQGFRAGPPGPDNDFWFQPVVQPTLSGKMVTPDTAWQFSTVYKCVRAYADAMGSMPRRLMRQAGDRKRERVLDHPVARLLSVRPNPWQTPSQFMGMLEGHAQLRGNGYAEVIFDLALQPIALVPLHPGRVTTEIMSDGTPRWRVKPPAGLVGEDRILLPGEMLHITGLVMDGYTGVSPIDAEREAIGSAIAARDFGSRFWNNDARPPFWIQVPGKFKDNDERAGFREQWQASYGGSNRGRPAVLDRGIEIKELGLDNQTAQWMEAREYSDKDLAGVFKVPLHKIGILSDAKYANIEQQAIEWVTDSLLPRIVMWEEVYHRDLLGYDEELYVKLVPDALLRGDTASRYEAYSKGITDGWITRNEVRALEDRDPLPGLDEPLQPLNMARANQVLPTPGPRDRGTRADAILVAAAERVARREGAMVTQLRGKDRDEVTAAFRKHARFVADVLALPLEVANGYAEATQRRYEAAPGQTTVDDWVDTQFAALLRLGE
jgi:HK97 family phage portal protein